MFEDSLLESGGRLKTNRGLTTTISVIFQVGLIGILVLLPLIFTDALPKQQLMTLTAVDDLPGGPPTSATTPATRGGTCEGGESNSDRYRERRASHPHQNS
jgi:periplasmic protein TonB